MKKKVKLRLVGLNGNAFTSLAFRNPASDLGLEVLVKKSYVWWVVAAVLFGAVEGRALGLLGERWPGPWWAWALCLTPSLAYGAWLYHAHCKALHEEFAAWRKQSERERAQGKMTRYNFAQAEAIIDSLKDWCKANQVGIVAENGGTFIIATTDDDKPLKYGILARCKYTMPRRATYEPGELV